MERSVYGQAGRIAEVVNDGATCLRFETDQYRQAPHTLFTPENQAQRECDVKACSAWIALQYGEVVEFGSCALNPPSAQDEAPRNEG